MRTLKKLLLSTLLIMGIVSAVMVTGTSNNSSVYAASTAAAPPAQINQIFPDSNLAVVIADTLGKSVTDTVTQGDLDTISIVFAAGKNIQNISGIEYLNKVQTLNLSFNQISDISPLATANMPGLYQLLLFNNQISDISPLATANMPYLDLLFLFSNQISDISPLATVNMSYLKQLDLHDNQISDISPLAAKKMPDLKQLDLHNNQISDISPLGNGAFNALVAAYISDQKITKAPVLFSDKIVIENNTKHIDGSIIAPNTISDSGTYSGNDIIWNLVSYIPSVSYTFKDNYIDPILPLGEVNVDTKGVDYWEFSGTVTQPITDAHNVNFMVDGSVILSGPVAVGDFITEPDNPVKDGYTFTGWYTEETGGTKWDFSTGVMGDTDINLYAHFEKVTATATVLPQTGATDILILGSLLLTGGVALVATGKNKVSK